MAPRPRRLGAVTAPGLGLLLCTSTVSAAPAPADLLPVLLPDGEGPLPSAAPGDPAADDIEDTAPFFATDADLAAHGYVEEEFLLSGTARRYADGEAASEHPYRPARPS